jgi:hypothetical protein
MGELIMRTAAVATRAERSDASVPQGGADAVREQRATPKVSDQDDDGPVGDEPIAGIFAAGSTRRTAPLRTLIQRADNRHYVK